MAKQKKHNSTISIDDAKKMDKRLTELGSVGAVNLGAVVHAVTNTPKKVVKTTTRKT
jgi:hypothetical protein